MKVDVRVNTNKLTVLKVVRSSSTMLGLSEHVRSTRIAYTLRTILTRRLSLNSFHCLDPFPTNIFCYAQEGSLNVIV